MNERVIRQYASILQRIFTEQTHGDFTAIGFCVEFASALSPFEPDFTTHRGRVEWVRQDAACRDAQVSRSIVLAVRRLHEQGGVDPVTNLHRVSLVDCRDAVYNAWGYVERGLMRNEWVA